jgi:hypothetical protein
MSPLSRKAWAAWAHRLGPDRVQRQGVQPEPVAILVLLHLPDAGEKVEVQAVVGDAVVPLDQAVDDLSAGQVPEQPDVVVGEHKLGTVVFADQRGVCRGGRDGDNPAVRQLLPPAGAVVERHVRLEGRRPFQGRVQEPCQQRISTVLGARHRLHGTVHRVQLGGEGRNGSHVQPALEQIAHKRGRLGLFVGRAGGLFEQHGEPGGHILPHVQQGFGTPLWRTALRLP